MTRPKYSGVKPFRFTCPDCGSVHEVVHRVELFCERCGKQYYKTLSTSGTSRFCSRACQYAPRELLPHPEDSTAMLIPLTQGTMAIIDKADAEYIGRFNWSAKWSKANWYAFRNSGPNQREHMHRSVLNAPAEFDVDHINGDTLDNRRANLRLATVSQNMHNTRLHMKNQSGYRGVFRASGERRWIARIQVNGTTHELGRFDTAEEAARARDAKAKELIGEFAHLNFPDE